MTGRSPRRSWIEPGALFGVALACSAAMWGRLWVTSPGTRGLCGCGDPSLFQWFLGWPAHALSTGHSLVFSRDLFHPAGVNLLANTSVLGLGIPLAPVTWLGGPVLTQNVALLLAAPVAALTMDLLLRRVSSSLAARVVLSLFYAFSPYVVASLAISHLMTAWIGVLPLLALGVLDTLSDDRARARRGAVLLACAAIAQFFVSTELLLLAAMAGGIVAVVALVTWLIERTPPDGLVRAVRRLAPPLGIAAALLVVPAAYALLGPRSLKGNIWGPGFNPGTGGTSLADLVRPHVVTAQLTVLSGYRFPLVQMQLLGWGLLAVAAVAAVLLWRDALARTAAIAAAVCLVLSLSPTYVSWAPWQWIGKLPVFENVLQFRLSVFVLLFAAVVVARGAQRAEQLGVPGHVAVAVSLAAVVVPVAVPVAQSLPLRTSHVAVPQWWRSANGPGVVLAYPYPGILLQSALTWQATARFPVSILGGSGPQGAESRAGPDAQATVILDQLSIRAAGRPTASPATAGPVRAMVERDAVTEVVVPIELRGRFLATGAPSLGAAEFFAQSLGIAPSVERGAWVFHVDGPLPAPRFVSDAVVTACAQRATPTGVVQCVVDAEAP